MINKPRDGLIWLFLLSLVFVLAIGPRLAADVALSMSSRTASAIVSENKLRHDNCVYSFQLRGEVYKGKGIACGSDFIGQIIKIYYWPTNPQVSSNQIPGESIGVRYGSYAIIFAAVLVVTLFRIRKFKR